jgi:hypothetical protein
LLTKVNEKGSAVDDTARLTATERLVYAAVLVQGEDRAEAVLNAARTVLVLRQIESEAQKHPLSNKLADRMLLHFFNEEG